MNLTLLKNYAPAARKAFMEAVTRRAGVVGIHPDRVEPVTESGDVALIGGQPFPRSIVPLRKQLLEIIHRDGFAATMEAMAYTWFNRLVAIRFMELHDGWLSHGYRVLSHPEGHSLPEIIQHAEHLDLKSLNREEVIRLKLAGNRDEELYRLLLLAQCGELNRILPDVFSRLDDATILLLPDNLLHSDSLVRQLVANSSEEDWNEVEVLGWLYQFYISEKKDAVMARKSAVPTDDIPAVTQLFTPHWIVRYLVENSLGRLWLLNRPNSRLREHMPYYIEGEAETDFLKITKPEDIRLVDPAVGSGHMLTYAFDLLVLIYEEEGYAAHDIPGLILKHNLHGLDLCPRAAQLAELALVFKAREKSRRFFQSDYFVRPNIIELKDIRFEANELSGYFKALGCQPSTLHPQFATLLYQFEEAKNFGSLIQPCLSDAEIQAVRSAIQNSESNIQNSDLMVGATHLKVLVVLEQAEALTQRYHVVVANPPYLGNKGQNGRLKQFLEQHFDSYNTDLFAAFIVRGLSLALKSGLLGFMAPNVWMFLSTHNGLRDLILGSLALNSLVELPLSGFTGATVQICAFTLEARRKKNQQATFIRLCDFRGAEQMDERTLEAIADRNCPWVHKAAPDDFAQIPGSPIAYWVSPKIRAIFATATTTFEDVATPRQGLGTGENSRFTRFWSEVPFGKIGFGCSDSRQAMASLKKWFPYTKGGGFRKWTGNEFDVVNWEHDGKEIREALIGKNPNIPRSEKHYFREGITWGLITSAEFSARYVEPGAIFDVGGSKAFPDSRQRASMLGLLNSKLTALFLKSLNPTLNFQVGDLKRIPIVNFDGIRHEVDKVIGQTIKLSEADWDNFETSWDFRDQPLLRQGLKGATLEASWRNWEAQSTAAIRRMQELETENNRLFIAAYGLEGELEPKVPEEQITLARADQRKDVAAVLSYALGCMMGRFSLSTPGLILANAGDTLEDYLRIVAEKTVASGQSSVISEENGSFTPDEDGIIPVLDGEWFDDDIVARAKEFLRVTFGEATLEENLRFIEQALGKELRSYFLNDFYKDHLQTYKNRPIYWLFSSGKQRAFQCLVYLHRYQEGTLARIRTAYVIPLQGKLAAAISRLEEEIPKTSSSSARKKLQTELDKTKKQMTELLAYDEQLRSYADQRIALDLDDGVKVNYAKFGPLVAEAKKICGTKED
jgi:hypothetical protein